MSDRAANRAGLFWRYRAAPPCRYRAAPMPMRVPQFSSPTVPPYPPPNRGGEARRVGAGMARDFSVTKGLGGPLPLEPLNSQPAREASQSPSQRSLSSLQYCGDLK